MCIQNPSKHLRWSFMEKKVNNSKPLAIYSKKSNRTIGSGQISNDNFCHFELQRGRIWNPVKHLRWSFLRK